jgi:hypothetical protein
MEKYVLLGTIVIIALGLLGAAVVQSVMIPQNALADSAKGPFHGCKQGSDGFKNSGRNCIHRD